MHDWEGHFAPLCAFWSSVALMSGRYHGQPMVAHLPLPIDTPHFDRWLEIFAETARRRLPAGGGGSLPRPRPPDRREPGTGHRGPEGRDPAEASATGVDFAADAAGKRCAVRGMSAAIGAGDCFMDRQSSNAITLSEDGFVVEAEFVAGKLGLSPDAFWREMKRGIVYGVVERGEGERCRSHAADFPLSRSVLVCDVGGEAQ